MYPCFKDVIKRKYYKHFLKLTCALRIMAGRYADYYHKVPDLLEGFVKAGQKHYGKKFVTHNVHRITHLFEDFIRHNDFEAMGAWPFENCLGEMKAATCSGKSV